MEEAINCRGMNGSLSLSKGKMKVRGAGLPPSQSADISYSQVSAFFVQRKSVVPFATLLILATIVGLLAQYNTLWFLIPNLPEMDRFIAPISFGVAVLCAIPTILRLLFVNVLVRYKGGSLHLRFVPLRSGKRLGRRFRELSLES
jgi:hypothetical protein